MKKILFILIAVLLVACEKEDLTTQLRETNMNDTIIAELPDDVIVIEDTVTNDTTVINDSVISENSISIKCFDGPYFYSDNKNTLSFEDFFNGEIKTGDTLTYQLEASETWRELNITTNCSCFIEVTLISGTTLKNVSFIVTDTKKLKFKLTGTKVVL